MGSGSSGNCYLLSTKKQTLILDCGISIKEIKKGLDFDVSRVVGVLVDHAHNDHSKALLDVERMGIPVFAPYRNPKKQNKVRLGEFEVLAFDLPHNGVPNYGFLINVGDQKLLYMTDFEYCPYTFKKQHINHMLIECNYQNKYINTEIANYEHKLRGHCELEVCKEIVKINRTADLRTVILCHLGFGANEDECKREIKLVAGCPVYVAERNVEVELK